MRPGNFLEFFSQQAFRRHLQSPGGRVHAASNAYPPSSNVVGKLEDTKMAITKYTFVPGDGIWYSPFGWGFYSPWLAYEAPFFGYGYYGGWHYPFRFGNYSGWAPRSPDVAGNTYAHGIYRGEGSVGDGFHSGVRMVSESPSFGSFGNSGGNSGFHGVAAGSSHSSDSFGGGFHVAGGFGGGRR